MFRRSTIPAVLAALALTASVACKTAGDKDAAGAGPTATVATEPAPTTTTNPYAVPAVIDAAYVNKVLAGLDAVMGDVTRIVIRTGTIPMDALDRLRAIYASADYLQIAIDGFQLDIRDRFQTYKPNPGNRATSITEMITARSDCIFARVARDYSAVGTQTANSLNVQWVALKPLDRRQDPNYLNPTTWAMTYDGFPPSHSQPKNPCTG